MSVVVVRIRETLNYLEPRLKVGYVEGVGRPEGGA
jgi:hypothetical protein